jgi:hypothetical protein
MVSLTLRPLAVAAGASIATRATGAKGMATPITLSGFAVAPGDLVVVRRLRVELVR